MRADSFVDRFDRPSTGGKTNLRAARIETWNQKSFPLTAVDGCGLAPHNEHSFKQA